MAQIHRMDDYAGPFDPEVDVAALSRAALAGLAREYMLLGHIFDRVGLPQVLARFGPDEMQEVSIEEWMGASPVYTRRMRDTLGFTGDDVATIFKGLQLDVGAPHEFMDFRMRVDAPDRGEFWLDHCGALLDVEPMGEDLVHSMCHDIEDPTFDATAVATNPRARMRPIHRPPRDPAGRHPHCHWVVAIDQANEPVIEVERTEQVRASALARLELSEPTKTESGGRDGYDVDFDPEFRFEDLSQRALILVCKEFAIQVHLLVRSYCLSIAQRHGADVARDCATSQLLGSAWISAERIKRQLEIEGDGIDAVLKVLQLHPALQPADYAQLRYEQTGADRGRITVVGGAAFGEDDDYSWFALLDGVSPPGPTAISQAVNPRARLVHAEPPPGALRAWDVQIDSNAEPVGLPGEVALGRVSGSADFVFGARR